MSQTLSSGPSLGHDVVLVLSRIDPRQSDLMWKGLPSQLQKAYERFSDLSVPIYDGIPFGRFDYFGALMLSDCFDLRGVHYGDGVKSMITLPGVLQVPSPTKPQLLTDPPTLDHYVAFKFLRLEGHLVLRFGRMAETIAAWALRKELDEWSKDRDSAVYRYSVLTTLGWPQLAIAVSGPDLSELVELTTTLPDMLQFRKEGDSLLIGPHQLDAALVTEDDHQFIRKTVDASHRSIFSRSFSFIARAFIRKDGQVRLSTPKGSSKTPTTWEARVVVGNLAWSAARLKETAERNGITPPQVSAVLGETDLRVQFPHFPSELDALLVPWNGPSQEIGKLHDAFYDLRVSLSNDGIAAAPWANGEMPNLRTNLDPLRISSDLNRDLLFGDKAREGFGLVQSLLEEQDRGLVNHQLYVNYLPLSRPILNMWERTKALAFTQQNSAAVVDPAIAWPLWRTALTEFHSHYQIARTALENATAYYLHADLDGPPGAGPASQRSAMAAWGLGAFLLRQAGRDLPDCICLPQEASEFTYDYSRLGSYVAVPRERQGRSEEMWCIAHEFAHDLLTDTIGRDFGKILQNLVRHTQLIELLLPNQAEATAFERGGMHALLRLDQTSAVSRLLGHCYLSAVEGAEETAAVDLQALNSAIRSAITDTSFWNDEAPARLRWQPKEIAKRHGLNLSVSLRDHLALVERIRDCYLAESTGPAAGPAPTTPAQVINELAQKIAEAALGGQALPSGVPNPYLKTAMALAEPLILWKQARQLCQSLPAMLFETPQSAVARALRAAAIGNPDILVHTLVTTDSQHQDPDLASELHATVATYELLFKRTLGPNALITYAAALYGNQLLDSADEVNRAESVFQLWVCYLWELCQGHTYMTWDDKLADHGVSVRGWNAERASKSFQGFVQLLQKSQLQTKNPVIRHLLREISSDAYRVTSQSSDVAIIELPPFASDAVAVAITLVIMELGQQLGQHTPSPEAEAETLTVGAILKDMMALYFAVWPVKRVLRNLYQSSTGADRELVQTLGGWLRKAGSALPTERLLELCRTSELLSPEQSAKYADEVRGLGRPGGTAQDTSTKCDDGSATPPVTGSHGRSEIIVALWDYAVRVLGKEYGEPLYEEVARCVSG